MNYIPNEQFLRLGFPGLRSRKSSLKNLIKIKLLTFFIRTKKRFFKTLEIWNSQSGFVPTFYDPAEVKNPQLMLAEGTQVCQGGAPCAELSRLYPAQVSSSNPGRFWKEFLPVFLGWLRTGTALQ